MKRTTKHMILTGAGVLVLAVMAAGAGAYVTQEMMDDDGTAARKAGAITWNTDRQTAAPQPQRVASACDDGNIVGTILGGVGGGIIGNQIGSGSGNDVATIGGAVGGAVLGNRYIPTDGVTCGE